jgi:hypothetical protein
MWFVIDWDLPRDFQAIDETETAELLRPWGTRSLTWMLERLPFQRVGFAPLRYPFRALWDKEPAAGRAQSVFIRETLLEISRSSELSPARQA